MWRMQAIGVADPARLQADKGQQVGEHGRAEPHMHFMSVSEAARVHEALSANQEGKWALDKTFVVAFAPTATTTTWSTAFNMVGTTSMGSLLARSTVYGCTFAAEPPLH